MKYFFLLLIVFVLTSNVLVAQKKVKGQVVDEEGLPMVGAQILELGTNNMVLTTKGGFFDLLLEGKDYPQIQISFLSYEKSVKKVVDSFLYIVLKPQMIITDGVIVSAIRVGDKSPIAHTNISEAELEERQAGEDIPYMLNLTPSAVATSETGTGLGYTALRIRGTDPTRINVTINGIPLNDSESQGVFWVNMPDFASSVDEVQVQRGVGSSSNGAAAFGASVNFQTTGVEQEAAARLESTVGSYGTFLNTVSASTGLLQDRFTMELRYSKLLSDGYINHAFSDHQSFVLTGGMLHANGLMKINIMHGDQRTGISWWGVPQEKLYKPEGAADSWQADRTYNPAGVYTDEYGKEQYYEGQTDNYKQTHYQLFYSHALNNNFNLNGALHYTRGEGYYEQYKEDQKFADYGWQPVLIGAEKIDRTDMIRQKWLENDFYGFTLSGNYSRGKIEGSFGGAWNKYEGDHFGEVIWARYFGKGESGERWYENVGNKTDYNFYGKLYYQLSSRLRTFIDLQYRDITYTMNGIDDDLLDLNQQHKYHFFNPKVGLFYEHSKENKAYASVGISNREPTRSNFKDAKGDPASYPKSERLLDIEVGYLHYSPIFSGGVNVYSMLYDDQLIPTGEKNNVGASVMTNVEDSYRMGIEAVWGVKFCSKLSWDGNVTWSRNKIKRMEEYVEVYDENWNVSTETVVHRNNDIAYSPNWIASSVLSYAPLKAWSFHLSSKYVGEQFFDNTANKGRQLPSYHVHQLKLNWSCEPSFAKKLTLQLLVNNLLDRKYENNAYGGHYFSKNALGEKSDETWAYYFPQAGRHFSAKVILAF